MTTWYSLLLAQIIAHDIEWKNAYEREQLGQMLLGLEDAIGNADSNLVKLEGRTKIPTTTCGVTAYSRCTTSITWFSLITTTFFFNLC